MSFEVVRCKTCKEEHIDKEHFDYQLKVHKLGKVKRCKECNKVSYPDKVERTYWFCKRECLDKFLEKNTNEEFKDVWCD